MERTGLLKLDSMAQAQRSEARIIEKRGQGLGNAVVHVLVINFKVLSRRTLQIRMINIYMTGISSMSVRKGQC